MKETVSSAVGPSERDWPLLVENIAAILLGATVFLIPYPHITSVKELLFYLPVTIALAIGVVRRGPILPERRLFPFMLLFGCWAFLASFFSLDIRSSLTDVFFHFFKYVLYYYAVLLVYASRTRLNALFWIYFSSSSLYAVILLINFYLFEGHSISMRLGLQNGLPEISTNLIPVITVVAFVFGLHLMFRTRFTAARILLSLGLLILAAATVSTQSRAAVISLFTAAAVILFFRNRVAMIVCLAVLLSLSSLAYISRENRHEFNEIGSIEKNVRISLALMAGGILEDYPITGIGFGTNIFGERIDHEKYNSKLPQAYQLSDTNLKGHTKEPHSMYTSIAIRTGLPGFGFFLLFVGAFLLNGIRLMRSENDEAKEVSHCLFAAMVGMLIVGLFERCLSPITDMVFYTVVAMEGILIRIDKEQMTS